MRGQISQMNTNAFPLTRPCRPTSPRGRGNGFGRKTGFQSTGLIPRKRHDGLPKMVFEDQTADNAENYQETGNKAHRKQRSRNLKYER